MKVDLNLGLIDGTGDVGGRLGQVLIEDKAENNVSGGRVIESAGARWGDGEERMGGGAAEVGRFVGAFS